MAKFITTRQLLSAEDLLLTSSTQEQLRDTTSVTVQGISAATIPYDASDSVEDKLVELQLAQWDFSLLSQLSPHNLGMAEYVSDMGPPLNEPGVSVGEYWFNTTTLYYWVCTNALAGNLTWRNVSTGDVIGDIGITPDYTSSVNPTPDESGVSVGEYWLNTTTAHYWECINADAGGLTWRNVSTGDIIGITPDYTDSVDPTPDEPGVSVGEYWLNTTTAHYWECITVDAWGNLAWLNLSTGDTIGTIPDYISSVNPTPNEPGVSVGEYWFNTTTLHYWVCSIVDVRGNLTWYNLYTNDTISITPDYTSSVNPTFNEPGVSVGEYWLNTTTSHYWECMNADTDGLTWLNLTTSEEIAPPVEVPMVWTTNLATMATARTEASGCSVGDYIYVVGSSTSFTEGGGVAHNNTKYLERYNKISDSWVTLAACPDGIAPGALHHYNGKLYHFGDTNYGTLGNPAPRLFSYDIASDAWTVESSQFFAAQVGVGVADKLYYATDFVTGLKAYDIQKDETDTVSGSYYIETNGVQLGDKLYFLSWDAGSNLVSYSLTTETWDVVKSFPLVESHYPRPTLAILGNSIFVFTQDSSGNPVQFGYDIVLDTFSSFTVPRPTVSASVIADGTSLYLIGGKVPNTTPAVRFDTLYKYS